MHIVKLKYLKKSVVLCGLSFANRGDVIQIDNQLSNTDTQTMNDSSITNLEQLFNEYKLQRNNENQELKNILQKLTSDIESLKDDCHENNNKHSAKIIIIQVLYWLNLVLIVITIILFVIGIGCSFTENSSGFHKIKNTIIRKNKGSSSSTKKDSDDNDFFGIMLGFSYITLFLMIVTILLHLI